MEHVLALVFIYASQYDWKTPLRAALTSKTWRQVILDTPAAWRLDILHRIPSHHVATWIRRSGDHRSILLKVPSAATSQWMRKILPHRKRIKRLRLYAHHDVLTRDFPIVTGLELFEDGALGEPTNSWLKTYSRNLTPNLYPSLQSLYISSDKPCTLPMESIATLIPVTSLFLECRSIATWGELLIACAPTVVVLTLKVIAGAQVTIRMSAINFPNVAVLIISGYELPFDLVTPRMTFLQLQNCHQRVLSSVNMSGVRSLAIDTRTPDPAHPFPAATRILVHSGTAGIITFLRSLSRNSTNHPNLSEVIVPRDSNIPDQTIMACSNQGITVSRTTDAYALEDVWRSSHMRNQ